MSKRHLLVAFILPVCCLATSPKARAQGQNPQAVASLTQSLNAAGGVRALGQIQDFLATGTITYYWAGEAVQGSATVRGRAPDQFRLDANLPDGTRSYAVSHGQGALKDTSGTVTALPLHNTLNVGVLTFPYLGILARLSDPLTTVADMGLVADSAGKQLHQIRVQRQFPPQADPNGTLAALSVTDYFLDPLTNLVVKTVDQTHPAETFSRSYAHEIDFESYTAVGGVTVPMLVREKIDGQTTWELHLSSITFNTGATDLNFQIQ